MRDIGDTKHVRVGATTRAKLKAYSKKTGLSMAVIVTSDILNSIGEAAGCGGTKMRPSFGIFCL